MGVIVNSRSGKKSLLVKVLSLCVCVYMEHVIRWCGSPQCAVIVRTNETLRGRFCKEPKCQVQKISI